MIEKRGRRFYYCELDDDLGWWWVTWRLFERMAGVATSEEGAVAAIDHFLESKSTYTQPASRL